MGFGQEVTTINNLISRTGTHEIFLIRAHIFSAFEAVACIYGAFDALIFWIFDYIMEMLLPDNIGFEIEPLVTEKILIAVSSKCIDSTVMVREPKYRKSRFNK